MISNAWCMSIFDKCVLQIKLLQISSECTMMLIVILMMALVGQRMLVQCSHGGDIPRVALSIVFIFGGLVLGGFLKLLSRRIHFSYNAMVLLSGIALGYFHHDLWPFLGNSVQLISQISPHSILAIFLPPLIFESAYKVEWHLFKRQIFQNLIMGVPCVLVNSFLIMIGFKIILQQYTYSWAQAFMLGSILSCTDIFSYISKLKEDSTPKKLIGLIEGESLFNYCTCVTIFQVMNEITINQNYTYISVLLLLLEEIFGGIVFGSLVAAIAIYWIRRISYDGILVVTITIICCYSLYIVSEFTMLPVSGITSLVTFGILMASFGRNQLSKSAREYTDGFWKYLVFTAETTIFLIAGVMVGVNIFTFRELFENQNHYYFMAIYTYILIARFFSFSLFIKWLRTTGYGMQWRQVLMVTFAGLKGAVGISFAMIIFEDKDYGELVRHLMLFHVTLNSILTISINPFITKLLANLLKLSTLTKVQYKFFKEFLNTFKSTIIEKKQQLKEERFLDIVDWNEVDNKVGIPEYTQIQASTQKTIENLKDKGETSFQKRQLFQLQQLLLQYNKQSSQVKHTSSEFEAMNESVFFNTLVEVRKRFIKNLIEKYWQYHLENNTSPPAFMLLLQSAYYDLDTQTEELESWQWIKAQISQPYIKFLSELRKYTLLGWIAKDYLFDYISYSYDVVSSYIQAHEQVCLEFKKAMITVDSKCLDIILNEGAENQKQAQNFLVNYLKPSFPQIDRQVKTKKASFNLLLNFKNIIDRFYETGQVQPNQYQLFTDMINEKTLSLQLEVPKWQSTKISKILHQDHVFGLLPEKVLMMLEQNLSQSETFDSNQFIYTQSNISRYIYFIRRGSCKIQFINESSVFKQQLVVGDCFGYETLVSNTYESTVTANAMVIVMKIKRMCIQKIMDSFVDFEQSFWKNYLFYFYKMFFNRKDITGRLGFFSKEQFDHVFSQFRLVKMEPGVYEFTEDGIFLRGLANGINQKNLSVRLNTMEFISSIPISPQITVIEKSSFLVGSFDYDLFNERSNSKNRFLSKKQKDYNDSAIKLKEVANDQ